MFVHLWTYVTKTLQMKGGGGGYNKRQTPSEILVCMTENKE